MKRSQWRKQFVSCVKAAAVSVMAISIFLSPLTSYCQNLSYEYLIELGEEHLNKGDYEEALHYFELAQIVNPSSKEAIYYFNLAKRLLEGRVKEEEETRSLEKEILIKKREDISKQKKIYEEKKETLKEDVSQTLGKEIKKKQDEIDKEIEAKLTELKKLEQEIAGLIKEEGRGETPKIPREYRDRSGQAVEGKRMRDEEKVKIEVKDKGKDEGRGMRDEGRKIEDEVKIKEKDKERVKVEKEEKEEKVLVSKEEVTIKEKKKSEIKKKQDEIDKEIEAKLTELKKLEQEIAGLIKEEGRGEKGEGRGEKGEGEETLREYSGQAQDEGRETIPTCPENRGKSGQAVEGRRTRDEGRGMKVEDRREKGEGGETKDEGRPFASLIGTKDEKIEEVKKEIKEEEKVKVEVKDEEKEDREKAGVEEVKEEELKTEEIKGKVKGERRGTREGEKVEEEKVKKKVKETVKAREKIKVINLTPQMTEQFPMDVDVYLHDSFTVTSERGIKRFLVTAPEIISVERLDSNSIKITANEVGSTFLHVWDDQGRWTFSIKSKFPKAMVKEKRDWEEVEGFKFNYNMNWSSYYEGKDLGVMERKSLGFNESLNTRGPTPYGELGGSINWAKLGDRQEVTGYTAALTKGHLGQFDDFNIHGFDVSASLSSLTLPGKGLYGVIFDSMAFNKKIKYTILHGEEESSYGGGWLSPGVESNQKSYIEGLRLELLPEEKNSFYFNYAQGRGEGRQDYLKDKVVSFQSRHNWEDMSLSTELASDSEHMAARFSSSFDLYDKVDLNFSLRDIEKKFVTITGKPSGSGEIGGTVGASASPLENISLSSNLDFYHDRDDFNEENPHALNYNWDGSLGIKLDSKSSISNSLYYTNTQGLSSPQRSLSGSTTYSRQFDFSFLGKRSLSAYAGYNYQKSVYPLSESSGYKRNGLTSGMQLKLIGELSYYMNYDYSWLRELASSDKSKTSVMTHGLSLSHSITPKLSSDFRLYYRDETKDTTSAHAFLSGEDSIEGSMGLTYSASEDAEIFFDGRLRNAWPDSDSADKTYNADVNLGVRLSWDSFFRWAPVTEIAGVVFKDLNGDGIYDSNEEGISQVRVIIGPKEAYTDEQGRFKITVKTRSVVASLDVNTMPEGYIVTTPASVDVDTSHGGRENINFGLSSQSGVYGVVFYDVNDNNKLDKKDIPIPGVKVTLDKKKTAFTNNSGVYFFSNITVGKHTVILDVNSIPLEYIPKISVKKEVEITEGLTYTHHIPLKKSGK